MEHLSISSAKPSYHGVSKLGGKELRILSFRKILEIFFFRLLIVTRVLLISILFARSLETRDGISKESSSFHSRNEDGG